MLVLLRRTAFRLQQCCGCRCHDFPGALLAWTCCRDCWAQDAADRPSLGEVMHRLQGLLTRLAC